MPANLNALIRYKTINSCLYGGKRRWTITELKEKCSGALAEYRGRYNTISERTIRDDIRVMRSDILGYNAPIEQQKGLYYYSDPGYSIMTLSFTDSALIERIIMFLGKIKGEVSHPELEIILDKLTNLKNRYSPEEKESEEIQLFPESDRFTLEEKSESSLRQVRKFMKLKVFGKMTSGNEEPYFPMAPAPAFEGYPELFTWGNLLDSLVRPDVR
jgi:hypothetical protein